MDADRRLVLAGTAVVMTAPLIPHPAAGDLAALTARFDQALADLHTVPVGTSSRTVAAVGQELTELAAGGLPAQLRQPAAVLAARVTAIRAELAGLAGHEDTARAVAAAAARAAAAAGDPNTIGTVARIRADGELEAGRPGAALRLVDEGLAACPAGPVAAALLARRAHALGVQHADPADVEQACDTAMGAVLDLDPAEHGTVGLRFVTYHPYDAADRVHSALSTAGLVDQALPYAETITAAFDTMGRPGFAAYARFERALALLKVGGDSAGQAAQLAADAVTAAGRRRTGELAGIAGRWLAATSPYLRDDPQVADIARAVHTWRGGRHPHPV